MGIILAVSQPLGKVPEVNVWVNIICRIGAIRTAHTLKIHVGMLSGPAALLAEGLTTNIYGVVFKSSSAWSVPTNSYLSVLTTY